MSYFRTPNDFLIEVQKGNVAGHSIIHKFGRNDAVASGVWEHISEIDGLQPFLTAVDTIRIKSGGNVDDDESGDGARIITVIGIDENLNEVSEDIITNGVGVSGATTTTFWRVHRAFVSAVGLYASPYNIGTVTIESSGGTALIQIGASEGQSEHGAFSIPTGKTGYMLSAHIQVDANKAADVRLFMRNNFNDTSAPVSSRRLIVHLDGVLGLTTFIPNAPMTLNALTDIWWEAKGSGAQTEVSVDFEILLVDD